MSVPLSGYATIRLLRASPSTRVYEAEHKHDGQRVIAKVFALTDDAVESRVMHEFRVLQSLDIDGVVDVLGLERAGNELVLLLTYVAGPTLGQYAGGRPLALDEFLRIATRLEDTLSLIHAVLRNDSIKLELEFADDLPQVRCRRQQIQQIIMNLVTNARDALNERYGTISYHADKRITIRATRVTRDGTAWARIAIEDRAGGIPEHIRARIFDPFFTTKARDQGTGLGLSVSHGIATAHAGELALETEVGIGTSFFLLLPGA